jgi:1-phosphatidylinositol-3-phosphate 5-kinase
MSLGQQKTLMLVRPHSKEVLRAAIKSDAEFLSRSNIMDYS